MTDGLNLHFCEECGGETPFEGDNSVLCRRGQEAKYNVGGTCKPCFERKFTEHWHDGGWGDEPLLVDNQTGDEDWRTIPDRWFDVNYRGGDLVILTVAPCLRCNSQTFFSLEVPHCDELDLANLEDDECDWWSVVHISDEHKTLNYRASQDWDDTDQPDNESELFGDFLFHLSASRFVKRGIVCDDCFSEVLSIPEEECTRCKEFRTKGVSVRKVRCPKCLGSGCFFCEDEGQVHDCCEGFGVTPETRNFEFFILDW